MTEFRFGDRAYERGPEETILDTLLREGHQVPNSCRSGVCQVCRLRCTHGEIPPEAQKGLKAADRERGVFLSCQAKPTADVDVVSLDDLPTVELVLEERKMLAPGILGLRFLPREAFEFRGGQFLTFMHPNGAARSYSIASLPADGVVDLQVRLLPQGLMSGYLERELVIGQPLRAIGPEGNCFYVPDKPEQPLVLAGTGTGMAPLWAILRDALEQGHQGPIHIFQGGLAPSRLYLGADIRALIAEHPQVVYHEAVLQKDEGEAELPAGVEEVPLDTLVMREISNPAGHRIFLCGNPDLVLSMRGQLFMAGASSTEIFADAFLPAAASSSASEA